MFEETIERVIWYQPNFRAFSGPVYNFKSVSGSGRVWTCIFGFGPDLIGPFTTLHPYS